MWLVIIVSFIAILLSFLSKFKGRARFFDISFIVVTLFAVIHYDYGTDYMTYYDLWEDFRGMDIKDLLENFYGQTKWTEPGWMLLNAIFGFKNGFFVMVALLNIIQNFIYYKLIKDYVPRNWYWLAMFLYLIGDNLYLVNFSMMRQGFTVALFVAAAMLMNKRKYVPAFALVFLSTTIHLSSVICFPFLILYFLPLKNSKTIGVAFLVMALVFTTSFSLMADMLKMITSMESLGKYGGQREVTDHVGGGYVILHIPNLLVLYALITNKYYKDDNEKYLVALSFCDIFIMPLIFLAGGMAGRLGIYFLAFRVFSIPTLCDRNKKIGAMLALFMVLITLYGYYQFFNAPGYIRSYGGDFHTIFSALE